MMNVTNSERDEEIKRRRMEDLSAMVLDKFGPEATGHQPFHRCCPQVRLMDKDGLGKLLAYVNGISVNDPVVDMLYLKNRVFQILPMTDEQAMAAMLNDRTEALRKERGNETLDMISAMGARLASLFGRNRGDTPAPSEKEIPRPERMNPLSREASTSSAAKESKGARKLIKGPNVRTL